MIRLQSGPSGPEVRRVPGGKARGHRRSPHSASPALPSPSCCPLIPGADETNKPLAVAKVLGGTVVLIGAGVAVFLAERRKARTHLKSSSLPARLA